MATQRRASTDEVTVESAVDDPRPARHVTERTVPLDQRMHMLDVEDLALELLDELVKDSLLYADTLYVKRRLMGYAARAVTDQLFTIVATCEPTIADDGAAVAEPLDVLTMVRPHEDPPVCTIDATCRLEIRSKEPPPRPASVPSTPHKSKRLLVAASLVASSMLSPSAASLTASPRAKAMATASPKAPLPTSPVGPVPGVPYSTAETESPRKSVALLKTAVRLASAPPSRLSPGMTAVTTEETGSMEDAERSNEGDSDSFDVAPQMPGRRLVHKSALMSPTATIMSTSAWSITLPGDPSSRDETPVISMSVDVEFALPQKLPTLGRRRSSGTSVASEACGPSRDFVARSPESHQRRGTYLHIADEQEAVEIDPIGMLGMQMREHLALSPGVKLQDEGGELVKSGPLLPEMPTKMRRSTFFDESLVIAAVTTSPTRPPGRPSTTIGIMSEGNRCREDDQSSLRTTVHGSSGVFSLTECAGSSMRKLPTHHHESTRSLAMSYAGSIVSSSSTTTSVKSNLFRKPTKVVRPCTAAACGSHANGCTAPADNAAIADLVKQRAFQRKPSILTAACSPPKKTQPRRSTAVSPHTNPASTNGAASPLTRRSLFTKTTPSSAPPSSKSHNDPLRHAAKIL